MLSISLLIPVIIIMKLKCDRRCWQHLRSQFSPEVHCRSIYTTDRYLHTASLITCTHSVRQKAQKYALNSARRSGIFVVYCCSHGNHIDTVECTQHRPTDEHFNGSVLGLGWLGFCTFHHMLGLSPWRYKLFGVFVDYELNATYRGLCKSRIWHHSFPKIGRLMLIVFAWCWCDSSVYHRSITMPRPW